MGYVRLADLGLGQVPAQLTPDQVAQARAEVDRVVASLKNLGLTSRQASYDLVAQDILIRIKQRKIDTLKKAIAAAAAQPGMSGLADGGSDWTFGQAMKLDADVRTGRWTDLLAELTRITPYAAEATPDQLLSDPLIAAILEKAKQNFNDPELQKIALTAIASMATREGLPWDGKTPGEPFPQIPPPGQEDRVALLASAKQARFDPAVWAQNFAAYSTYVQSHKPQGGGVLKTLSKTLATLDQYVPGWSIVIDIFVPGGSLALLPLLGTVASSLPIIGPVTGGILQGGLSVVQSAGSLVTQVAGGALKGQLPLPQIASRAFQPIAQNVVQPLARLVQPAASTIFAPVGTVASVVVPPALNVASQATELVFTAAQNYPFAFSRVVATYVTTNGPVLQKLQAASIMALEDAAFAIVIAAAVLTGGQALTAYLPAVAALAPTLSTLPTLAALPVGLSAGLLDVPTAAILSAAKAVVDASILELQNKPIDALTVLAKGVSSFAGANVGIDGSILFAAGLAIDGLKAGITVARAQVAAKEVKKAADAAKRVAVQKVAELDAETAKLQKQLEQIQAKRQEIAVKLAAAKANSLTTSLGSAIKSSNLTTALRLTPGATPILTPIANALGVSEGAVLVGGVAFSLFVFTAVFLVSDD